MIDSHHHLWDLGAVSYPWLEARGVERFFGDPSPSAKYLLAVADDAADHGISASVHIQVGAADPLAEARWVQSVAMKIRLADGSGFASPRGRSGRQLDRLWASKPARRSPDHWPGPERRCGPAPTSLRFT